MKGSNLATAVGLIGCIIFSPAFGSDVRFVHSSRTPCPEVCQDRGLKHVSGGQHAGGHELYLCIAEDGRGGYNFEGPHPWEGLCHIGVGGKEQGRAGFHCLCISREIDIVFE